MGGVRRSRRTGSSARRAAAALAALALAAALAACDGGGDPDDPDDPDAPGGAETSTTTEPGEPSPSEPTEPTETETSEAPAAGPLGTGAAPANGEVVTIDALTVTLPQGWKVDDQDEESFIASPREYNLDYLRVIAIRNDGLTSPPEEAFQDYLRGELRPPNVEEPIEIDGVPMWYAWGQVQKSTWVDAFGSDTTPYTVSMTFEQAPQVKSPRERRELVDSIMATLDLTE